jgi:hypothetical protein
MKAIFNVTEININILYTTSLDGICYGNDM